MASFAHISDVHIGAFRQPVLQDLVLKAFSQAMDECLNRHVDFVVICGDLFDSNIPDMSLLNSAVRKMSEVKAAGIPLYVIYGSHDFSPTQRSIVDILESARLFTKVTKGEIQGERLELEFTTDDHTGAHLCGISGRSGGIDKEYFDILDRAPLEKQEGFKIFLLHGLLSEYKSKDLVQAESMPVSSLPRGFAYYAGGHVHEMFKGKEYGFNVAYPGALFGDDFADLEKSAKGQVRGFFIVEFSTKVDKVEFIPVSVCGYQMIEYDATGKTSAKVRQEVLEQVSEAEPNGKVVLLKVFGEMSTGKTSDVDFQQLKTILKDNGALEVLPNQHKFRSKEYEAVKVAGENIHEIEETLFRENIGAVKVANQRLKGQPGIKLSRQVLDVLKQPKFENETKITYEGRITTDTIQTLKIEDQFK